MVTVLGIVLTLLIGTTCLLALVRIVRGPSILDRLVGNEIITAAIICGLGAYMVLAETNSLLVVLLALAIFSSAGSISVARYVTHTDRHAATFGANPRLGTRGGDSAQGRSSASRGGAAGGSGTTGGSGTGASTTGAAGPEASDAVPERAPVEGRGTPESSGVAGDSEAAVHPDEVQEDAGGPGDVQEGDGR